MRLLKIIYLLLFCAEVGAQGLVTIPRDTATVPRDSIAWNKELGEVTVTAQRQLIKQEIDRIGYDVQADEESKTKTVMDMLRKVPMVTVDGQDNITVKGNASFKIYRNGHLDPSLTKNAKQVFKSMPASMVKRIEVITDPGAREDAEGVDAILNIVMVDGSKMKGMTGVVNAFYNTLRHPNLYASLTGQAGRLLVSADGGYGGMSRKESYNRNEVERTFLDTGNRLTTRYEGSNPGHVVFADLNASYDIDSLNLLSASFGGYFYKLNVEGDGTMLMSNATGQPLYGYSHHNWMPGYSHHSWNGRLDYQHQTRRKGEQLTLSYMLALTRQHTDDETLYDNILSAPFAYTGHLHTRRERFTEHTLQADWLRPLTEHHQLEVGVKYIDRNNNSHDAQQFYSLSPVATDLRFDHTTRVLASYADYIFRHKRWSARAGLRYEYSYMQGRYPDGSGDAFSHRLSDWVPQASVKWQLTESQSLKLNYTTSINRPGISYLDPAVVASPTIVQQGNAHLVSARSQMLSLTYMYIGQRLTLQLAPSYHWVSNGITSVQTAQNDVRYLSYDNVQRHRRVQFEQYVQWRPFTTTTFVLNNNVHHERNENPNLGYKTSGWSDNYYFDLSQQLPWRLRFSLGGYGQIGHRPQGVYSMQHSWYGWYANLQRSFLKEDRLTIRLGVNDLQSKERCFVTTVVNGDYRDRNASYNTIRQLNISVTYRFGSLKAQVKKVDRSIENDDLIGGISKR